MEPKESGRGGGSGITEPMATGLVFGKVVILGAVGTAEGDRGVTDAACAT